MVGYRHMQTSYVAYSAVFSGLVLLAVLSSAGGASSGSVIVIVVLLAMLLPLGMVFGRLTVSVDSTSVLVAFGWGWPRRRIDLADVMSVHQVRNRWYEGWGIHRVPGGWLYNVGGFDAVELKLCSGKVFRIGTDEPAVLAEVVNNSRL
jgi:hypothetical protein